MSKKKETCWIDSGSVSLYVNVIFTVTPRDDAVFWERKKNSDNSSEDVFKLRYDFVSKYSGITKLDNNPTINKDIIISTNENPFWDDLKNKEKNKIKN